MKILLDRTVTVSFIILYKEKNNKRLRGFNMIEWMNTAVIRDLSEADYKDLERIISDTWSYEKFCGRQTADHLAALYLQGCLGQKTFAKVAVLDGRTAGIIVGKAGKPRTALFPMVKAALKLCSTKEGRQVCRFFGGFNRIDSRLLKETDKKFDGELVFFALSKEARGLGIGQRLWKELEQYFRSVAAREIYVYTDSTCNYGFYEHHGFGRIGEYRYTMPEGLEQKAIDFYIYEKRIPEA